MKHFIIITLLALQGCAQEGTPGPKGPAGAGCTVYEEPAGTVITCDDGTMVQVLDGKDGVDGENGSDGEDGIDGVDGAKGAKGKPGEKVQVSAGPIYKGLYCGKTMIVVDGEYYIISNGLISVKDAWVKVSNTCSVKVDNEVIYVQ